MMEKGGGEGSSRPVIGAQSFDEPVSLGCDLHKSFSVLSSPFRREEKAKHGWTWAFSFPQVG